ncbi:MAG: YdcF family protein [Anaerolineae bacterium]|nr:YdcF family protein [Anaerolineae bacterium]
MANWFQSKKIRRVLWGLLLFWFLVVSFPFLWRGYVQWQYGRLVYEADHVPSQPVAIVFGAGLRRDGFLSAVLVDRMDVAIALYEAGIVQKLLVSGDNRFENYNEPGAMMAYAISRGVDPADVQPDYGGRRTYDSCYRARHIFQVDEAILVTQEFHLPRALFTCEQLGVDVVGVSASSRPYLRQRWFTIREMGATLQALADVLRREPAPVLGEPIPLTN